MNTVRICGEPVGTSGCICMKHKGHGGEHDWILGEVLAEPRNMYKFLEDHRMYVLDKSGHLDLEASAKAADELQALWVSRDEQVNRLLFVADRLAMNLKGAANWNPDHFNVPAVAQLISEWRKVNDEIRHLQLGQAVTPSASKNP